MGKFSNSWDVTKATFAIMKQDHELYLYPIFSAGLSVLLVIGLIITGFLAFFTGSESVVLGAFYALVFVAYFGIALISSFFQVATSYTAACRFGGENATMGKSFRFCFSRFGTIVKWALLSATVGLLLKGLENLGKKGGVGRVIGRIVAAILGLAWSVVTVFVIPVIVYENLPPFPAIKRSVEALKKTWGESLIKWAGVTVIRSAANIAILVLTFFPAFFLFFMGAVGLGFALIALGVLLMVTVSLVLGIADEVFDTALYVYATTGTIPTGYEQQHMNDSFQVQ